MKIELNISTETLGDTNTPADNQRYAEAVKSAIEIAYPDADVSVTLKPGIDGSCRVSDDPAGETAEEVHRIANQVWDSADY